VRPPGFGALLRQWRVARRLSQPELSAATGVSTRHLSFLAARLGVSKAVRI
jgi:transcriptional regulator with XRE-family HTH domain